MKGFFSPSKINGRGWQFHSNMKSQCYKGPLKSSSPLFILQRKPLRSRWGDRPRSSQSGLGSTRSPASYLMIHCLSFLTEILRIGWDNSSKIISTVPGTEWILATDLLTLLLFPRSFVAKFHSSLHLALSLCHQQYAQIWTSEAAL